MATVVIAILLWASAAGASDWSVCGIKPPPPIKNVHSQGVCACTGKNCQWIWIKK